MRESNWVEEYIIRWMDDGSIDLLCDECGSVNHWGREIEFAEVLANVDDHHDESHGETS